MAQYLLSIYQPDGAPPSPEALAPVMRKVGELVTELKATGKWVFNAGLHPTAAATVVRSTGGAETLITDGPYIEAKEHVGGLIVIDVADLDEAMTCARRLSRALTLEAFPERGGLPVEVRPVNH